MINVKSRRKNYRDQYYDNVVFLLRPNSTNDSTTFTDLSKYNHTITNSSSGVLHKTSTYYFPNSSAYLDGSNRYLYISDHSSLALGSSNFTIEAFFYVANTTGSKCICGKWSDPQQEIILSINNNTPEFWFSPNSNSGAFLTSNTTISANTWYHIAVVRSGNNFTMYLNGTSVATGTNSGSVGDRTAQFMIGMWGIPGSYGPYWPYNGYIDSLRYTIGIARYTSSFTVPWLDFFNSK